MLKITSYLFFLLLVNFSLFLTPHVHSQGFIYTIAHFEPFAIFQQDFEKDNSSLKQISIGRIDHESYQKKPMVYRVIDFNKEGRISNYEYYNIRGELFSKVAYLYDALGLCTSVKATGVEPFVGSNFKFDKERRLKSYRIDSASFSLDTIHHSKYFSVKVRYQYSKTGEIKTIFYDVFHKLKVFYYEIATKEITGIGMNDQVNTLIEDIKIISEEDLKIENADNPKISNTYLIKTNGSRNYTLKRFYSGSLIEWIDYTYEGNLLKEIVKRRTDGSALFTYQVTYVFR